MKINKILPLILAAGFQYGNCQTQASSTSNPIATALPFLSITPDTRSGAMGEAAVALPGDAFSVFHNPASLAFAESTGGVSLSYNPWLSRIIPGLSLSAASFYHRFSPRNTLTLSARYFNAGQADLYDEGKTFLGYWHPYEFCIDGSLARSYGGRFSMALSLRYIYSLLSGSLVNTARDTKGNSALAADASFFINAPGEQFGSDALLSFGAAVTNIGPRINYGKAVRSISFPPA